MIVTVTPNPALDLTYSLSALDRGESQRVPTAHQRAGGKGVNVARVVHQVGFPVTAIAATGGETGRDFAADLVTGGIPHRLISSAASTRRSITLFDRARNETTVLNEEGSPFDAADHDRLSHLVETFAPVADCLTGSGSLPPGAPPELYGELVSLAVRAGVPSVIDATGEALLHAASAGATVLKPNRRELAESTHEDDPIGSARQLLDRGAKIVIVSLGEDGLIAVAADRPGVVFSARHPHRLRGNPTGAGDAVVAAIAVSMAERIDNPEAILRRAVAWGAAAVMMPQAGELAPNYHELESLTIVERH